ncbi:MAG: NADH:ubiquinone oxidoreductase [Spirochaetae bacterium HGW-Spirochaetae-5]|nr:MAG: NADH:ubiquinone oxidoreductase [Spirochaetae bacterium HGW-Spirochaetae-5]
MINLIRTRIIQGKQYISDIRKAEVKPPFRGFPFIKNNCSGCGQCIEACPSGAIEISPAEIDLGKCTFCGECERRCLDNGIEFSVLHKISADSREKLKITKDLGFQEFRYRAIIARKEIKKLFGRSLKLRSVSAGGCNGCEMELNACSNVNFDMGRFGIEIVASPKHADGIIITGPITENMTRALYDSYLCTTPDRILILMGACAISGGVFQAGSELNRDFISEYKPDLYIPGCPVHPLTFINGIIDFLGKK